MKRDARSAQLAAIHVAKKALGLDDETYRLAVATCSNGRTRSAGDMNDAERRKLLEHFEARGFHNRTRKPRRQQDDPMVSKIRALWLAMHAERVVRDPSEKALRNFVQGQTGVKAVEWLSTEQATQVIESLKQWQRRCHVGAATV